MCVYCAPQQPIQFKPSHPGIFSWQVFLWPLWGRTYYCYLSTKCNLHRSPCTLSGCSASLNAFTPGSFLKQVKPHIAHVFMCACTQTHSIGQNINLFWPLGRSSHLWWQASHAIHNALLITCSVFAIQTIWLKSHRSRTKIVQYLFSSHWKRIVWVFTPKRSDSCTTVCTTIRSGGVIDTHSGLQPSVWTAGEWHAIREPVLESRWFPLYMCELGLIMD